MIDGAGDDLEDGTSPGRRRDDSVLYPGNESDYLDMDFDLKLVSVFTYGSLARQPHSTPPNPSPKMKASLLIANEQPLVYKTDLPTPKPTGKQVLLETTYAGVCHSGVFHCS
jgi:hypothetical protein